MPRFLCQFCDNGWIVLQKKDFHAQLMALNLNSYFLMSGKIIETVLIPRTVRLPMKLSLKLLKWSHPIIPDIWKCVGEVRKSEIQTSWWLNTKSILALASRWSLMPIILATGHCSRRRTKTALLVPSEMVWDCDCWSIVMLHPVIHWMGKLKLVAYSTQ